MACRRAVSRYRMAGISPQEGSGGCSRTCPQDSHWSAHGRAVRPAGRADGRRGDHASAGEPQAARWLHLSGPVHRPQCHFRHHLGARTGNRLARPDRLQAAPAGPGQPVRHRSGRAAVPVRPEFAPDQARLVSRWGVDLARTSAGTALTGDPRNDENLPLAQLHLAFVKFHNQLVDLLAAGKITDAFGEFLPPKPPDEPPTEQPGVPLGKLLDVTSYYEAL